MAADKTQFDSRMFRSNKKHCFKTNHKPPLIKNCHYLNRLIHGLKYYTSLSIANNEIFMNFIDKYPTLLNDYTHLIDTHGNDLEHIYNQLIQDKDFGDCSIDKCIPFKTHFDQNRHAIVHSKQQPNPKTHFYVDLFNNTHHFLFHLFHIGMRTTNTAIKRQEAQSDEKNEYKCVDYVFAERRKIIENKRNKHHLKINRYSDNNNKFNINITYKNNDINTNKKETFVDVFCKYIKSQLTKIEAQAMCQFITHQQYDTDCIIYDIYANSNNSNLINNNIKNKNSDDLVTQYIHDYKLSSVSFSTGFIWFYWSWYKNGNTPLKMPTNVNDYSGYTIKQLFVKKKYQSYKQELLHHISMNEYTDSVLFKAQQYMNSDKVKELRVNKMLVGLLNYHIKQYTPITIKHIMSIILYCDFSKYCCDFSSTFRKLQPYETLVSVKKRNQEFWWQSKLFREAVELYGSTGYNETWNDKGENGPFYSGVNTVLIVSSFCIRLCSPTSTSKHIEVSLNFAKRDGIILQLNNNGHGLAFMLPFFN
eukprot:531644_1